ncbi:phospholipase D active site protein motif protein [Fonsecaea pedrosoi]|nr:phospholipase D active site protein motif protein [Fonsecaea pedrosoi]
MIPKGIYDLCQNRESITSQLAQDPSISPHAAAKRLFGVDIDDEVVTRKLDLGKEEPSDLEEARKCGQWGTSNPSDLFLRIYHDVLCTLEKNPLVGVCSPSLLGSNGVCPLTIMATVPDICRHMSNVIARAEQEVFLATNFWMYSEPTRLITNALRELSRKAVLTNRRVVVKIIYDRGSAKQHELVKNHLIVPPSEFADPNGKIRIPHPDELPNIDIEVMNFHRPMFGTFHAKYMVVDRRIAILQSNNIQDIDNLEMMTQLEGPIVDSFYDVALISWHNALKPPLPLLSRPAADCSIPTFTSDSYATMFDESGKLVPVYQAPTPIPDGHESLREIAEHGSQMDLPQHTSHEPHYDPDIKSEVLRAVACLNPREGETRINAITRLLNTTIQPDTKGSAADIEPADTMTPLIPIPRHDPFPMAMVCRQPWGAPTKHCLYTPQNAAFMSALRHAAKSVFIQTPDLNAEALLPEIVAACRRGVKVTYYYCLGYNDAGELLPMQGGHNEMIANGLYRDVGPEHRDNLDIYAYVAKDQIHPIHNKFKQRSCHIKLMIVDGHIGIQGNGNQDTQSWYHSQEVNVMIDSPLVVGKWMEGIRQNQNTHIYGKVENEGPDAGCWKDPRTGQQAEGAIGVDPGKFAWAKGVVGAVQRVRGMGGF